MAFRRHWGYLIGPLLVVSAQPMRAASLEAGFVELNAGESASIVVSGTIAGEATYGVTILVEIVARAGNTGAVEFTLAPPTDIAQLGDPWPGVGTFTAFDTDAIGLSASTNGSIDDNGTFLPAPITYSGPLAVFPVVAGTRASGTWDVVLSTSVGNSAWEGVGTTWQGGTITVTSAPAQVPAASWWTLLLAALLVCIAGSLLTGSYRQAGVSTRDKRGRTNVWPEAWEGRTGL